MTKRWIAGLCATVLCASLAGCGLLSDDAFEPVDLVKFTPQETLASTWSVRVGESRDAFLTPAVVGDTVYAAGAKNLMSLDAATGKTRWSVTLPARVAAGVGADDTTVAVITVDGVLRVYDNFGQPLWTLNLPTDSLVSPLVGHGVVVVETADSRVSAYDARTGEMRWNYLGTVPPLTLRVYKAMSFSPFGILVGQSNGRLIVLNDQGQVQFDVAVGIPKGVTEIERLSDVVGAPLVDGSLLCAAAFQGDALCLNSQNGQVMWAQPMSAVTAPVADAHAVYVTDSQGYVHAFDKTTGAKLWENKDFLYRRTSTPAVLPGGVAVGDYEGYVTLLDGQHGELLAQTRLSGAVRVPAQRVGNDAIFQTVDGDVVRLHVAPLATK